MDTPSSGIAMRRVFALGYVAGFVTIFGFVNISGLYPAPMTGNTVQLAMGIVHSQWPRVILIGSMIGAFFSGGVVASVLARYLRNPSAELLLMAGVIGLAQLVKSSSAVSLTIELPLLAVAMAMQGETASRFGGRSIQTIVVTNTLLKCADALVGLPHWKMKNVSNPASRAAALGDVVIPAFAWLGYLLGAGSAAVAVDAVQLPLLIPIAVLIATALDIRMFPEKT